MTNRGNYQCRSCGRFDEDITGGGIAFIKSRVNRDIDRWHPRDTVTITNGSNYAVYQYLANGNFVIIETGNGNGPGEIKDQQTRSDRRDTNRSEGARDDERRDDYRNGRDRGDLRDTLDRLEERDTERGRVYMEEWRELR